MDPQAREREQAMVLLETWGSTTFPPTDWEGFAWAEENYAPEWVKLTDAQHDECTTVLACCCVGDGPAVPEGWRIVEQWTPFGWECPWCGPGTGNEDSREACELCEGDGLIYWGEEWQGVVFAPRYSYGSGSSGCLYDYGPNPAHSVKDAIDALVNMFGDSLEGQDEENAMRTALREHGIYRFAEPGNAGADYCQITDLAR